ncbi:MAG: HDIG domain-containing metalloprotein [Negativicutes bacterium]|jgi:putative nucleotidyltransferase with HDIG domain
MTNRLKQFFRAFTAKIVSDDLKFVKAWLNDNECVLFFNMSIIDQKHCINVAHTAEALATGLNVDMGLLIKVALLHDCGRKNGDLGITGKSFTVIFDKVFGYEFFLLLNFLSELRWFSRIYRLIEVYYQHSERSASELTKINCSAESVKIVLSHHKPATGTDCIELRLLKQADSMN